MTKWIRDDGIEFDTQEEAWEDAMEGLDSVIFSEYFSERVSFHELCVWAMRQPNFYDEFGVVADYVAQDFFEEYYHEAEIAEEN